MRVHGQHIHLFQVLYQRVVTPADGQMLLRQMHEHIQNSPHGMTWQVLKIENVNRFGNPFPEWLANLMYSVGCEFEDMNMVYQVPCSQQRAYQLRLWFEREVRPWASADPRWTEYMKHINSRVLDVAQDTALIYDSF